MIFVSVSVVASILAFVALAYRIGFPWWVGLVLGVTWPILLGWMMLVACVDERSHARESAEDVEGSP